MLMSPIMIFFLLLGPGLLIASLFVKRLTGRAMCILGGTVVMLWIAHYIERIPLMYEKEHRAVENQCHRQIIVKLDHFLAEGKTDDAMELTGQYLTRTADSSFMRAPLSEIVQSFEHASPDEPSR